MIPPRTDQENARLCFFLLSKLPTQKPWSRDPDFPDGSRSVVLNFARHEWMNDVWNQWWSRRSRHQPIHLKTTCRRNAWQCLDLTHLSGCIGRYSKIPFFRNFDGIPTLQEATFLTTKLCNFVRSQDECSASNFSLVAKRLFCIASSAGTMWLRFILAGFPTFSHKHHDGDCCWCRKWHLDSGSVIWFRRLLSNCFKDSLGQIRGWSWVMEPDCCILGLVTRTPRDSEAVYQLVRVLRLLGNAVWQCRHSKVELSDWEGVVRTTFRKHSWLKVRSQSCWRWWKNLCFHPLFTFLTWPWINL